MERGTMDQARSTEATGRQDGELKDAVDADCLFKGRQVLVIEFRGERYQLRKTRQGKLILTK